MRIEDNNAKKNYYNIDNIESGTLVKYRMSDILNNEYYGIIIKDIDGTNAILYDIEDDVYYNDIWINKEENGYRIIEVITNAKIVIE